MSTVPVYEVEFIPLERRLIERRVAAHDATLPPGIAADRRHKHNRRAETRAPSPPKQVGS